MSHILRADELPRSPAGTLRFEGSPFGADGSFFLIDNAPGQGPDLHCHPYAEVFIVRAGHARFSAGGESIDAFAGDLVVVEAGEEHGFVNAGPGSLDMTCIHASGRMAQVEVRR